MLLFLFNESCVRDCRTTITRYKNRLSVISNEQINVHVVKTKKKVNFLFENGKVNGS